MPFILQQEIIELFLWKMWTKKNSALVKYVKMIDAIKSDCDDKKKTERNAKKQNAFDLNVEEWKREIFATNW